jgi:hypothetical protein
VRCAEFLAPTTPSTTRHPAEDRAERERALRANSALPRRFRAPVLAAGRNALHDRSSGRHPRRTDPTPGNLRRRVSVTTARDREQIRHRLREEFGSHQIGRHTQ